MLGECYVPLAHKKNLHELLMSNSLLGVSTIILAVNVTIDTEGLIDAVGHGWKPGYGTAPGIASTSGSS
jgi:hypothetical protein